MRAAVFAALLLAGSARADPWELWPEANLHLGLGPTTRLYFVAAYSTGGKESVVKTLDVAGYFNLTLNPLLSSLQEEWQRKKYLWVRIGYDHVFKIAKGSDPPDENRGIIAIYTRAYLPAEILLEGRALADLRWIGGSYSTRYRLRLEVNRDFSVSDRVVTPWVQAEIFYDTRYDGWARQLYQVGAEIQVDGPFRIEPYVARQVDTLPSASGLWAFGLVARWYL